MNGSIVGDTTEDVVYRSTTVRVDVGCTLHSTTGVGSPPVRTKLLRTDSGVIDFAATASNTRKQ